MSLNKLTKLNLSDNIKSLIKSLFLKQGEVIDYLNRYLTPEDQYQTTIVNISSSQILNMNGEPGNNIELLPAPGLNKYYQVDNIILEYTHNTTPYANVGSYFFIDGGGFFNQRVQSEFIIVSYSNAQIINPSPNFTDSFFVFNATMEILDQPLLFKSSDNTITNGDGTMRAIIKYKIKTFGE
jgi:hypothetical protein